MHRPGSGVLSFYVKEQRQAKYLPAVQSHKPARQQNQLRAGMKAKLSLQKGGWGDQDPDRC